MAVPIGWAAEPSFVLNAWFSARTNLHTWSADVRQTRTLQALAQPLVSTGKVWVALPDRFRWELGQPPQTIALRQPEALFVIYPRLKRAEKYPLQGRTGGPWQDVLALLEASFPRSRADLESRFRVMSVTQTNANWALSLQPKSSLARRLVSLVLVSVRTNDFSLAGTEMRFADGSSLRNDFTKAEVNPALPAGCFEANLGADITVVEPLAQ